MVRSLLLLAGLLSVSCNLLGQVLVGADRLDDILYIVSGKRVGIVANHTSLTSKGEHIVDVLVDNKVNVSYIFAPEHGFRGTADAGEKIGDQRDKKTGVKVVSIYGNSKRPADSLMANIDVVIFDLQDVGVRFFTYVSSMHYIMEAAAANSVKVVILDRPNPNGFYVDGPILNPKHKSFVGIYPLPLVHGMTLGEIALMAKGFGWFTGSQKSDIEVLKCLNYNHYTKYDLPVKPSPNLPNMTSIYLYPSVCLFEGTPLSLGRGTDLPFQVFGHPSLKGYNYSFTPRSVQGAKNPPLRDQKCYGRNLSDENLEQGFTLKYIIEAYKNMGIGEKFFTPFFEKLVGVDYIRTMIIKGNSEEKIRSMWSEELTKFKAQRAKYLLYE